MAPIRGAGGVLLCVGLQVLGVRRLLIAFLFVMSTNIVDVHCQLAPAPAPQAPNTSLQNFTIVDPYEAGALIAILRNWGALNPQFSTILNWALGTHPCNGSVADDRTGEFEGTWGGVFCTPVLVSNATGNYYEVSVTRLRLFGSNSSCGYYNYGSQQCGFDGIIGELPSEIINLKNLRTLNIRNHPNLTGPVPPEIWQMPNLIYVNLRNNSLVGSLPSNFFNASSNLTSIDLSRNKFDGSLEVGSQGTLVSSSLLTLDLSFNQLGGSVDFQGLNARLEFLDLRYNSFYGTFFTGPSFDARQLDLSNNAFTSIKFVNYTVPGQSRGPETVSMPSLYDLDASNNKLSGPFPPQILQMPRLLHLNLSGNNLSGLVDFKAVGNSWVTHIWTIDLSRNNFSGQVDFRGNNQTSYLIHVNISNNNFNGTFFSGPYIDPEKMDLSNNYFDNVTFDIYKGNKTQDENAPQVENGYMPSLNALYIQNNKLSGDLEIPLEKIAKLEILNIENNNLNGTFPFRILESPSLKTLYSGQNHFEELHLANFSYENLTLFEIILTNNSIHAIQYAMKGPFTASNLQFSNLLLCIHHQVLRRPTPLGCDVDYIKCGIDSLGGNPICKNIENELLSTICRMNRSSPILSVVSKSDTKNKVIIAASSSTACAFVFLITTLYVWRLMGRIKSLNIILGEFEKKEVKPNLYSYREIKLATNNFDKKNKLGEGGFGVVYKGELFDHTIVAVKKLTKSSGQVLSEFLNEVVVISGLKHRNLVKLKGCCLGDGDQRMLVFEYVENKNLAEALRIHGSMVENYEFQYLDWATRFNIILGTARGLAYLHEDLQSPIIHRDIKAANILLDKNYNPKIADFGLAYLFPAVDNESTHLTLMEVAGTRGYCSPEYALQGHISTALDVYSFGIVVLEIVSGRKCIDLQKAGEEIYLREWAWTQFEAQASMTLIDPKMKHSSIDFGAIMRVISVALTCVHFKAAKRPKMHNVVHMLLGNMPISDSSRGVEYGEVLGDVDSNFTTTSHTTLSL